MKIFLGILLIFTLIQKDDTKGSLAGQDYSSGPIPFNARIDSLINVLGKPNSIEHAEGYCGKGPRMRGTEVIEGDTVYCDSLVIYRYDSLTICTDKNGIMEYYFFTTSELQTIRGIHVGDTKEKILSAYGEATWMDNVYEFDDPLPNENDSVQYVVADDYHGIVFYLVNGRVHRIYFGRGSAC